MTFYLRHQMASSTLTNSEIEKSVCVQCNPVKWKGMLIESLKKITEQVHPLLTVSNDALKYIEMLVIQCLEILILQSSTRCTVNDIEDQVKRSFPKPIDAWAIKYAKEVLEKKKKKKQFLLPIDKIQNLIQKEILQHKLECPTVQYVTAVLEYIALDILKLSGNYVINIYQKEIGFQDLCIAIRGDKVLMELFDQHNDTNNLNLFDFGIDNVQKASTTYEEFTRDLINDERQLLRDLDLILKIFKEKIYWIVPSHYHQKLNRMFSNIADIYYTTELFLQSIEDILEIAVNESAAVGYCIEEFAENAEFDVFERYLFDIHKNQCRNLFWNLIGKPGVSNLLSADYNFKIIVKYYFPKLLLLPLCHCLLYFEYIKILHQLSPSQHDKECLEQAEGILKPLQLRMAASTINLPDNFRSKLNATSRRLLATEKLNEIQKSVYGWDDKDMKQCCTEFIREGVLIQLSSVGKHVLERKAILFDGVLILLGKSNSKKFITPIGHQFIGGFSEFKLKEKLFIRKLDIIDREDSNELENSFEIVSILHSPIILAAKTFQEKADWMADLIMLNTKTMLDRTLNSVLLDEDKKFPLQLPSIQEYRFVEPDSRANIVFEEKDNSGVPLIKGATLLKLVERLTYHVYADPKLLKTFLTTYRSFCSPHELMDLLIERYNIPEPSKVTRNSISLRYEKKRFKKQYLVPVRFRVLNVIRHWICHHYYDFERDPDLLVKLQLFLNFISGKSMNKWTDSVIKILQRKTKETQREITFTFNSLPPPIEFYLEFSENDDFNILLASPVEFARQLTLIQFKHYRAIKPSELVKSVWITKDKESSSPNLLRSIKISTNFTHWIEKVVVECKNLEERIAIVSRFIEVMMALDELNNFNGVSAVVSALFSASVFRLKFTFQSVNNKLKKTLKEAQELFGNHYQKYKEKLRSINPPCVPFLGLYMLNINRIEEGKSNYLINDQNLINFNKRRQVAAITEEIEQYQNQPYCLSVEHKINNFLMNLNPFNDMTDKDIEDYLYTKSFEIEPRNCKQPLEYSRKWPNLNLKSPGLKKKVILPLVPSKELKIQAKINSSLMESPTIPTNINEAANSIYDETRHCYDVLPDSPTLNEEKLSKIPQEIKRSCSNINLLEQPKNASKELSDMFIYSATNYEYFIPKIMLSTKPFVLKRTALPSFQFGV